MLYDGTYAINGCKFLAVTYVNIVTGNLRKTVHLSLKQVLPSNSSTDYRLKALMLGKVLTSPKLSSTSDYLLFPDEECKNLAKAE